jgi:hypothetical protein
LGLPEKPDQFIKTVQDGIDVYYSSKLKTQAGAECIRIRLKKILFWQWLEIEGAKSIPIYAE